MQTQAQAEGALVQAVTEQKQEMERLESSVAKERRQHEEEVERLCRELASNKAQAETHTRAVEQHRAEIDRLERLLVETQRDSCQVRAPTERTS